MAKDGKKKAPHKKAYKMSARKPWVQRPTAPAIQKLRSMRVYADNLKTSISAFQRANDHFLRGIDDLQAGGMSDDDIAGVYDELPSFEKKKAEYAALMLAIALLEALEVDQDKPLPKQDEDDEDESGSGSHGFVGGPFGGGSSGLAA